MQDSHPAIAAELARRQGKRVPVGYVYMNGRRPRGPLRATEEEALKDAVADGGASVCLQYRRTFLGPGVWIAPIYP